MCKLSRFQAPTLIQPRLTAKAWSDTTTCPCQVLDIAFRQGAEHHPCEFAQLSQIEIHAPPQNIPLLQHLSILLVHLASSAAPRPLSGPPAAVGGISVVVAVLIIGTPARVQILLDRGLYELQAFLQGTTSGEGHDGVGVGNGHRLRQPRGGEGL